MLLVLLFSFIPYRCQKEKKRNKLESTWSCWLCVYVFVFFLKIDLNFPKPIMHISTCLPWILPLHFPSFSTIGCLSLVSCVRESSFRFWAYYKKLVPTMLCVLFIMIKNAHCFLFPLKILQPPTTHWDIKQDNCSMRGMPSNMIIAHFCCGLHIEHVHKRTVKHFIKRFCTLNVTILYHPLSQWILFNMAKL